MSDTEQALREALAASDMWLKILVDRLDLDTDSTSFDVNAISTKDKSVRKIATTNLSERLAANRSLLEKLAAGD